MDLQKFLDNACGAARAEKLASSEQLTLGEIILKLEAIPDKSKNIVFDFNGNMPGAVDSWRGIYKELAVSHADSGNKTVQQFLEQLKDAVGHTFEGYKGGDFTMSRQTPVWVAEYGESSVDGYKGQEYTSVGIVNILDGDVVTIVTQAMESY